MTLVKIGTWSWGIVTVMLALACLFIVIRAGLHLQESGGAFVFRDLAVGSHLPGLFYALKENGNLVAGILGFSGLAWTHFFTARDKTNKR